MQNFTPVYIKLCIVEFLTMNTYIQHPFGKYGAHVGANFLLEDEVRPGRHVGVLLGQKVTEQATVIQHTFVSESSLRRRTHRVNFFRAQQSIHVHRKIRHYPGPECTYVAIVLVRRRASVPNGFQAVGRKSWTA